MRTLDGHVDRSDPGARASSRLRSLERSDRVRRIGLAIVLIGCATAAPLLGEPVTGDPGATVGALVVSLLAVGLAVVVWPYAWSPEERRHHELEAIWREARTDADASVPWERYAAWAESRQGCIDLVLICCGPAGKRIGGAPTPYGRQIVCRLDADDIAEAAQAMEGLREDAARRETRARERHSRAALAAEQRAYDQALRDVDEKSAAELRRAEAEMRRELAREQAAEREAQAHAVARALRRP